MFSRKKLFCLLFAISLISALTITALPEEKKDEESILPEGTKIYLEKGGEAFLVLEAPVDFEPLGSDGKWIKTQITGWVLKSNVPEDTEMETSGKQDKRSSDKKDQSGTDGQETEPIVAGEAGPFHIIINTIFSKDKVEDRFGTTYDSGSGGSFLVMELLVRNTAEDGHKNLYKTDIKLIDNKGRHYKSVGISNEQSFDGGSIKPSEEHQGRLFFSIFNDSTPKKIQISGRPCNRCKKYKSVFKLPKLEWKNSQK